MRLLPAIEEAWEKFRAEAEANGASVDDGENTTTYTERDPISEDWLTRGKLVRLDHVIMAAHIMAARYTFKGLSKIWVKILRKIAEQIGGIIAGALAKKAAGQIAGKTVIGQAISLIIQTVAEIPLQIELETAVRVASFQVRSDIYRRHMGAKRRHRRATKLVLTRKVIPPQRRPNKSWRSPKR